MSAQALLVEPATTPTSFGWLACEATRSFLCHTEKKTLNASIPFRFARPNSKGGRENDNLCRGVGIDDESNQVPKGYLVDALALRGDEGRGTLR